MHVQQMTSIKFNSDGTQKHFSRTVTTSLSVYIFNLDDNDNKIYLVKVWTSLQERIPRNGHDISIVDIYSRFKLAKSYYVTILSKEVATFLVIFKKVEMLMLSATFKKNQSATLF